MKTSLHLLPGMRRYTDRHVKSRRPHRRPFCPFLISTILQLAVLQPELLKSFRKALTYEPLGPLSTMILMGRVAIRSKEKTKRWTQAGQSKITTMAAGGKQEQRGSYSTQGREGNIAREKKVETNQPTALLWN